MEPRADEARKSTDNEKAAQRAATEPSTTTMAIVHPAALVPASSSNAAPVEPMAALEGLSARLDRFLGGAGGQPPVSKPVAEQTVRATVTDTATIAATASTTANVTPCITPSATLNVTPNVMPNLTPNVTPNREQFETGKDTSIEGSALATTGDRPFANAMEVPSEARIAVTPTAVMAEASQTPSATPSVTSVSRQVSQQQSTRTNARPTAATKVNSARKPASYQRARLHRQ